MELEINQFLVSKKRQEMLDGERYYNGKHDILGRKRTVIGESGKLQEVDNLPNNRIVDNQYRRMVVQKNNYLLGKPITIQCDNEQYAKKLNELVFTKKNMRLFKNIGKDSINGGVGWLFLFYDDQGQLTLRRFRPWEIRPVWKDDEYSNLEYAIRIYEVLAYEGKTEKIIQKVEVYSPAGVDYYELNSGQLEPVEPFHKNYFTMVTDGKEQEYNWSKIPLIPFRQNDTEMPLIRCIKSLQDGINLIESNFQNNMEEDTRNTILVLLNYGGENLGEFRHNLATYGVVCVETIDKVSGDVKTLNIEVNAENYKAILEIFKKAIIENAMGYDAKDDRMSGSPNQMNIQSMYSDVDIDANGTETEYQAAFEELFWFVNAHLYNTGQGDFFNEKVTVIFDRDMIINETQAVENCINSIGMVSDETILANHPFVKDVQQELERIAAQKQKELDAYGNAFSPSTE